MDKAFNFIHIYVYSVECENCGETRENVHGKYDFKCCEKQSVKWKKEEIVINKHMLENKSNVIGISAHGFKFSDGTESDGQSKKLVELLTCKREESERKKINGMAIKEVKMLLTDMQRDILFMLCESADIVILPFPVLVAMREMGIREYYANAVAFNATPETRRAAPQDKIVDINCWSW